MVEGIPYENSYSRIKLIWMLDLSVLLQKQIYCSDYLILKDNITISLRHTLRKPSENCHGKGCLALTVVSRAQMVLGQDRRAQNSGRFFIAQIKQQGSGLRSLNEHLIAQLYKNCQLKPVVFRF